MPKVVIGTSETGPASFDLDVLRASHLLVTAASGAGKSYLLRVIAEVLFGSLPIFLIDPEEEYPSLREKFPFVLAGDGGDIPIHPSTAALTAEKFVKLNVSAIFNLYSLADADRHLWLKNFLHALLNLPRKDWKALALMVDEAHIFCPEKGEGESLAGPGMSDVATRGRKRGILNIWATQRLSMVRKTAAAMLQNTMIGRTVLDNDRQRAAKQMGVINKEKEAFFAQLKNLQRSQFYTQGVAFQADRVLIQVKTALTHHPEPGSHKEIVFPTPSQIRGLLPSLSAITKEAADKEDHERNLEKENQELREKLAALSDDQRAEHNVVSQEAIDASIKSALEKQYGAISDAAFRTIKEILTPVEYSFNAAMEQLRAVTVKFSIPRPEIEPQTFFLNEQHETHTAKPKRRQVYSGQDDGKPRTNTQYGDAGASENGFKLGKPHRRILSVLLAQGGSCNRKRLAVRCVYSHKSGNFRNALSDLRTEKYVTGSDPIEGTHLAALADIDPVIPVGNPLIEEWKKQFEKGGREMLTALIRAYPSGMTRQALGEVTGYAPTSGNFRNCLSRLRRSGIIEEADKKITVTKHLFK